MADAGTPQNLQTDPVMGEMVSKIELKKCEKAREREAKKAAAAAAKPAPAMKASGAGPSEELTPNIENGKWLADATECLAGRIHNIRASGSNLLFYDLHGEGKKVQIMAQLQYVGTPSRTKKGELSISPSEMTLLAPNLHQLPSAHFGLKEQETRYHK
ncbi:hypothetical protein JB92DRAFT_2732591 [Gautieria morchelliformis]|nr:hypothetical protein JB92DRAFT_2732591 [Gautieria morchelliformis]